jgi:predicted ATP-grasp superfamily ATP-dependent carboligase
MVYIASRIEKRIHLLINAAVDCKCLDSEAKKQAFHYLKSFTGISAMGFFHLKKSLLSSIAVNFITYLIILMQFKMSDH